jgi:hypothetical protein
MKALRHPRYYTAEGRQAIIHQALLDDDYKLYKLFVADTVTIPNARGYSSTLQPVPLALERPTYDAFRSITGEVPAERLPLRIFYSNDSLQNLNDLETSLRLASALDYDLSTVSDILGFAQRCHRAYEEFHRHAPNVVHTNLYPDAELIIKRLGYLSGRHDLIKLHGYKHRSQLMETLRNHPLLIAQYAQRRKKSYGMATDLYSGYILSGIDREGKVRKLAVEISLGETRRQTHKSLAQHWRKVAGESEDNGAHILNIDNLGEVLDLDMLLRTGSGGEEWRREMVSYSSPDECTCDPVQLERVGKTNTLYGGSYYAHYCLGCGKLSHTDTTSYGKEAHDKLTALLERYEALGGQGLASS